MCVCVWINGCMTVQAANGKCVKAPPTSVPYLYTYVYMCVHIHTHTLMVAPQHYIHKRVCVFEFQDILVPQHNLFFFFIVLHFHLTHAEEEMSLLKNVNILLFCCCCCCNLYILLVVSKTAMWCSSVA